MKRVTVLVEDRIHEKLTANIPHGFRRHVLSALIELSADAIAREGEMMIGALMTGEFKLVRNVDREAA